MIKPQKWNPTISDITIAHGPGMAFAAEGDFNDALRRAASPALNATLEAGMPKPA